MSIKDYIEQSLNETNNNEWIVLFHNLLDMACKDAVFEDFEQYKNFLMLEVGLTEKNMEELVKNNLLIKPVYADDL